MTSVSQPLIWIDLEMTGLDPDSCFIIEIGSLVTTSNLELIAEGPSLIIHNSPEQLESLSDWCLQQFGPTGFLDKVRASNVSLEEAEERTLEFVKRHAEPGVAPLCGNSVHHDREFLRRHMTQLHDYMHYRIIDVSTVKQIVNLWYPGQSSPPPKADRHRALTDIRESVHELRYYRDVFFKR